MLEILTLYNILKELSVLVTVYLDTKHCELKQCNDKAVLASENCKNYRRRVGLSLHSVCIWHWNDDLGENGQCKFWWGMVGCMPKSVDTWCWGCHVLSARTRPMPGCRSRRVGLQVRAPRAADPLAWVCKTACWVRTRTLGSLLTRAWGLQTPSGVVDPCGWVCKPCREKNKITIIIVVVVIIVNNFF